MEVLQDFSGGVALALPPEKIADTTSPRAFNTALVSVPGGGRALTKRPGYRLIATPGAAAGATVEGMEFFRHNDAGTIGVHHIGLTSDGKLWDLLNPVSIELTIPDSFASNVIAGAADGAKFAAANNALFGCTGGASFKCYKKPSVNTVYVAPIGITRPSAAPTQDSVAAGEMNGTYDIGITYYNEHTGTESSLSDLLTVTLTDQTITIAFGDTPTTEVTHRRVYIRRQGIMVKMVSGAALQFPVATHSSAALDFNDTELNNFTILAPDTVENNPAPEGIIDLCWHLSRMFATDGRQVFYSKVGNPEQWDPSFALPVNKDNNQRITALVSVNDSTLLVFKERSIYAIVGQTPQTWDVDELSPTTGCISKRGIAQGDGFIAFESQEGPRLWQVGGAIEPIGDALVGPLVKQGAIVLGTYNYSRIAFDPLGHRFLFTWNVAGTFYWTVAPYSVANKVWESIGWDLPFPRAVCTGLGATQAQRVFFSGAEKTVYELDPLSATDAAANTTGANLHFPLLTVGVNSATFTGPVSMPLSASPRCTVIDTETLRTYRTSCTVSGASTAKTVNFLTSLPWTPTAAYIVFDCPVAEWDSHTLVGESTLFRKRWLFTYLEHAANFNTPYFVGLAIDSSIPVKAWHPVLGANHVPEWSTDSDPLAYGALRWRGRIARQGKVAFLRVVGYYPESKWFVLATGVTSLSHHGW